MRSKVASPREYQVAVNLKNGDNASDACRKAGYPEAVVRTRASKIAKREQVRIALLEMSLSLKPGELGSMAKARIQEKILKPPKEARTALGFYRTALEIDGMIGGPNELHLHSHATLPPAVQKMLEDKMLEILKGDAIEVLPERTSGEGKNQENHDGVQIGELTHGFQDRAIGEV